MISDKTPRSVFGLALIGLAIVALVGVAMLAVLADELVEREPGDSFAARNSAGDEFSGQVTAWLFGASGVPVGVDLLSRVIIRFVPLGERVKGYIRRVNHFQRKYLMCLHTYLSVLALGFGILHLAISSCTANLLPELGLILAGVLVISGLLFRWTAVPAKFRKTLYQFHASLITSGALLVILYSGHALMELD